MATLQERLQEKRGQTLTERQNTISVGGVPLSLGAKSVMKPNLSSNPLIGGIQQIGANIGQAAADVGIGVARGGLETVRQAGQLGGMLQSGITAATGISGPRTTAFDEGGKFDQLTTPQGPLQKAGYAGETAAEILPAGGKVAATVTKPILKAVGRGVEKLAAEEIPVAVQSALKETKPATFERYAEAAKKATESYKNPTPLELAGESAQGALDTIQRKLSNVGASKAAVLEKAAVGRKPVGNIAVKFRQSLENSFKSDIPSIVKPAPVFETTVKKGTPSGGLLNKPGAEVVERNLVQGELSVAKSAIEGDEKLVRSLMDEAEKLGNNPTAAGVDRFIDFAQDRIYTAQRDLTVPVTDRTVATLRREIGMLNESLKSELPESYRTLNDQYSKMVGVRNELNTKLGKEGEKGGALMKRVFSPSDANTKKLFAEVKELTGVDLVDEATVARYVMESAGDARQASLLQQLQLPNLSKSGILQFLFEKATKRFNTPEKKIQRARELIQSTE